MSEAGAGMVILRVLFLAIVVGAGLAAIRALHRSGAFQRTREPRPTVFLSDVARMLRRLEQPYQLRGQPLAGDLRGDFTAWFDGGALRQGADTVAFAFSDGSSAVVTVRGLLRAELRLQFGTEIRVSEERLDMSTVRSFAALASVLELAGSMPRLRMTPEPGDAPGDFNAWFDGGTLQADLGGRTFALTEGASVRLADSPQIAATVDLPGGRRYAVVET